MSHKKSMQKLQPEINFERSELRYIFYSHDFEDLLADFQRIGFKKFIYEKTPVTRTIYFGSRKGLKPGLSIKGRIYSDKKIENISSINKDTIFSLLEIKSTLSQGEAFIHGLAIGDNQSYPFEEDSIVKDLSKDVVFRIQKASEDGLLRDSTFKTKNRLNPDDFLDFEHIHQLSLNEMVTILTQQSKFDTSLSNDIKDVLNSRIRPLYWKSLIPYVMTQYCRMHLVPEDPELQNIIRLTIDPGVEYYKTILETGIEFIEDPRFSVEYLERENFYRLEFKILPKKMREKQSLVKSLSDIIKKYRCMAYLSKKWTGVTLVSDRYIKKQAFWLESFDKEISGFFPVDSSWFSYDSITDSLLKLIQGTESFSTYKKKPRVLVKNENYVQGYIGIPSPSLVVKIQGPKITYSLPPVSYPVKLVYNKPEFYISEEFKIPVRSIFISSKEQLQKSLHPSIQVEGYSFFRSYGFLVMNNHSDRVYKLTIEKKTGIEEAEETTNIYCKMRYIGAEGRLYKVNEQEIYDELEDFYQQFSPIMTKPLDLGETNLESYLQKQQFQSSNEDQ